MSIKNTKIAADVKPEVKPEVKEEAPKPLSDSVLKEVIKKPRKIRKIKEIVGKNPVTPKPKSTAEEKKKAKLEAARKLIAEHERLVKVLDSGTPKAQKKEAKVQKKDLVEAKKDLVVAKKEVKKLKEEKKPKKEGSWIEHVKKVQASKGISYREAMKVAKDSYKK